MVMHVKKPEIKVLYLRSNEKKKIRKTSQKEGSKVCRREVEKEKFENKATEMLKC